MNYEIPAETNRLLNRGKEIAAEHALCAVTSPCLLLSIIEQERMVTALASLNVDTAGLTAAATQALESYEGETLAVGKQTDTPARPVGFNEDSRRIIKVCALENKITGGSRDGAQLLLLAILHDRTNDAKSILSEAGVRYEDIARQDGDVAVQDDFSFVGDEDDDQPASDTPKGNSSASHPKDNGKKASSDTPVIDKFGTDLTAVAAKGGLDPVVGREREIQRIVQILSRRKKNNPIIIGEPGVGKSAIVEGLADRIAKRRVPHILQGKRIVALDMASIVAGTQYRGQFEERLRRLIAELKEHAEIILFIDEIHTLIGAGSAPGTLDAANILKPALARGEVQCIGATTIGEFKKSIEKDGALDRRFQKILVEQTTAEETLTILQNIKERYERHHNVRYTDEALRACVELTTRYVSDRSLPDKAIDALDEAGARTHLSGESVPQEIEALEKQIAEVRALKKAAAERQNYEDAALYRDQVQDLQQQLDRRMDEWQTGREEHPSEVNEDTIAEVVSMMSGVPATRVATDESVRLKGMRSALNHKVIAQEKAVERLSRAIMRSRLGLKGNDRPIGTFLFVGPTGVGKTHLVKCLAEWMFGSKDALIRIDMSEYGEKFSVSRLVGAPPGYVGYEEGGQLTERVRRHPYSVVLLDEIEKAHPDVFNTLLQVMDEGRMTDGNGTTVDFRNTIIILTSNSGSRQIREFGGGLGFNRSTDEITGEAAEGIVQKVLRKQFAPEFLNRLDDIIMFAPLSKDNASSIANLEITQLIERLTKNGLSINITPAAVDFVVQKGFDAQYGARSLKRSIQHHIEDALCDYIMEHPEEKQLTVKAADDKVVIETE